MPQTDTSLESDGLEEELSFEDKFYRQKKPITLLLIGLVMVGVGVFYLKSGSIGGRGKVEIIETNSENLVEQGGVVVEVSGAVEKPGVYTLESGARIEDALIIAGGLSDDADKSWIEKFINRAAKITDGQKLFIPREGEQSTGSSANNIQGYQTTSSSRGSGQQQFVNINIASAKELEDLWGIGPVTAQNIIEQRPYSNVEELLSKKILKTNVYERNRDVLTVY